MNEWSTKLQFQQVVFQVSEANILIDLKASLPTCDLTIARSQDFLDFISPNRTEISFTAGLNVSLPVFAIVGGFGFGKKMHQRVSFVALHYSNSADVHNGVTLAILQVLQSSTRMTTFSIVFDQQLK